MPTQVYSYNSYKEHLCGEVLLLQIFPFWKGFIGDED